jgi:hypothetical protein
MLHTWTSIGHAEEEWPIMQLAEVLIVKLLAIDTLASRSIAGSEITTLDHELLDDSVESAALVVKWLAGLAYTLLTSAESTEVLSSLGDDVAKELEDNAAGWLAANGDVEEDTGTLSLRFRCHRD